MALQTFEEKTLTCSDCGRDFIWTSGEQEFYAEKRLQQPKRCKPCRDAKRAGRSA